MCACLFIDHCHMIFFTVLNFSRLVSTMKLFLVSFLGLPTVQVLITCSMQKHARDAFFVVTKSDTLFALRTFKTPVLGAETTRSGLLLVLLTLPPSVYLGRHCLHSCDKILSPRPSPYIFVYCKQSKTGRWEGLGTRLVIKTAKIFCNLQYYSVSHGHTPFRKRGKGSGNFCCSHLLHRNSFTRIVQVLRPHN